MIPFSSFKRLPILLIAVTMWAGAGPVSAERSRGPKTPSNIPGAGLNRIFSSSSAYGPLGRDRTIAADDQLLLFWSEPPSSTGNVKYAGYNFQIMNYLNTPSLSPGQRLYADGSLTGDSVTDAASGAKIPAIGGSEYSVVLAGDMTGSGTDQAVAVWETYDSASATPGNKVFAAALTVNSSTLKFDDSGIAGDVVGSIASNTGNILNAHIRATMADLTGSGRKDLVVAWQDSNYIELAVYGWSSSSASHLVLLGKLSTAAPAPLTAAEYSCFAVSAGNFTEDSTSQISLAGFNSDGSLYIKLFKFENGGTIVAEGSASVTAILSSNVALSQITMATGDLTGDNYKDCIALALTDNADVGVNNTWLCIARPSQDLKSISVSSDSSVKQYQFQPNGNPIAASIGCGDLNGDGKDEIALDVGDEVIVFEAVQNGSYLIPSEKSNTFVNGSTDEADYEYSSSFLKVGSVHQSRKEDISVLRTEYSDDGSGYIYQALDIAVIEATDSNFTLSTIADEYLYKPENVSYSGGGVGLRRHYALAVGNFGGASLMLGHPTHYYKTDIVQPLVILNAPPVQFDIFNDTTYDVCNVFNGGSNAGSFATTYSQSTSNTDMMETNVTSSWGIGASLSGSVSYLGAKVEASLDTHYGQDFSRVSNSSYTSTVSVNVSAQQEDEIYAIVDNYDLWEYPVIDSGQVRGHVLVTVPSPPQGEWFDTESWTAYSFIPDHVVGNVLSYLTYDSLADNPYMMQKIKGSLSDGFELGTAKYTWSLTTSDFASNSVSETETFKMNVDAKATVGGEFGGLGAEVTAGVSGDYSNSNLTSHTSTVTSTLGLTVNLGTINQSLGEDQYIVTPYSYWGDNGALVIDYAVQPVLSQPGGTETWWQQHYGHEPDPALALPYLYWPQEGFTVQNPEKIYQTKEIFNSPSSAAPGDTITTSIRVHNYSLIPTDSTVQIKCYVGNPDNGGTLIKSINGDTVFSTPSYIPARGSEILSFQWIAPAQVNGRFIHSGDYVHVWADVDPDGTIKEIHTNNNKGWSILEVPGVVTGVEAAPVHPTTFGLSQNYPNPFNPTTMINYQLPKDTHVKISVYNILGQRVVTLVDGEEAAGYHQAVFNGARFASGIYFYRMATPSFSRVEKMLLLK